MARPARKRTVDARTEDALESLFQYLRDTRGFTCAGLDRRSVRRHFRARMASVGVDDYSQYRRHLEAHPEELPNLFDEILQPATVTTVEASLWSALEQRVVPAILALRGQEESIRVWSAGSVSEHATLALVFAETMGLEDFRRRVRIFCTAADDASVQRARGGRSTGTDIGATMAESLRRKDSPFNRIRDRSNHRWILRPELRERLIFGRHDLARDPPISHVDLVLCRNTLFRLSKEQRSRALARIWFALRERGILVLGGFDCLPDRNDRFRPFLEGQPIFEKVPGGRDRVTNIEGLPRRDAADQGHPPRNDLDEALRGLGELRKVLAGPDARSHIDRAILAVGSLRELNETLGARIETLETWADALARPFDLAPSALVISDLDGTIVRTNHAAGKLLGTSPGPEWNVARWPEKSDRMAFQRFFQQAVKGQASPSFLRERFRIVGRGGRLFDATVSVRQLEGTADAGARLVWSVQDESRPVETERMIRRLVSRLLVAEEDTRRKIARELHDSTGQILAAADMNLEQVRRAGELEPRQESALDRTSELLQTASQEIRTLSYGLHPPVLDDLGFVGALESLATGMAERSQIRVDCVVPKHFDRPAPDIERLLYRVAQEGLANVVRHSGSKRATVRLRQHARSIVLEVEDSGRGFPQGFSPGVGILGMRERLADLGGKLEIDDSSSGVTLRAVVPTERKEVATPRPPTAPGSSLD